jgi:hypothetical protein
MHKARVPPASAWSRQEFKAAPVSVPVKAFARAAAIPSASAIVETATGRGAMTAIAPMAAGPVPQACRARSPASTASVTSSSS